MSYNIIATELFEKSVKRLVKKYPSVKKDLEALLNTLTECPFQGIPLGKNCFKIRLSITSKGRGKSGGARLITFVGLRMKTFFWLIFMISLKSRLSVKNNWKTLSAS